MNHDTPTVRKTPGIGPGEDMLRRLEPLVRSVVARFTREQATADELAQACRIRLYEKRKQCRDLEAVFAWAKKLCHRVCVTEVERERRDRDRFVDGQDFVAATGASTPDPLVATETGEMRRRLARALQRLPAEQRRLLLLRYWHGLSAADIARRMNLPAPTVRTRLRRSCLRLRRAPEIICYAPRRPSLWSQPPRNAMVNDPFHGSRSAPGARGQ